MLRIISVEVEDLENKGCNNGNYPEYELVFIDGNNETTWNGTTCRCGNGCSGTDHIPEVGAVFTSEKELEEFMCNEF